MANNNKVLIIGCGVSGLSCGIRLQEHGYKTRIIASKLPPETTSNIAPAYWYPYKVYPLDRVLNWGAVSYEYFSQLKYINNSGVSLTSLIKLYDSEVQLPAWTKITRNLEILCGNDLPEGYGFGFSTEVPLIETPIYMYFLFNRYINTGGEVLKLDKDLESVKQYTDDYSIIINCTGLGSYNLFNDRNMYPIRGQIVRVTNPGINKIFSDQDGHLSLSYIVPRSSDCILGGTAEENNWDDKINMDVSIKIISNCRQILPGLKDSVVLDNIVGLRPGRNQVRLELEEYNGCKIVHNYGHGGAGFTLSWGCAKEVADIVKNN